MIEFMSCVALSAKRYEPRVSAPQRDGRNFRPKISTSAAGRDYR